MNRWRWRSGRVRRAWRSDFGLLQQSLGGRGKRVSGEAMLTAFDLLYFEGRDPRQLEFLRGAMLKDWHREGETGRAKLAATFFDPSQ